MLFTVYSAGLAAVGFVLVTRTTTWAFFGALLLLCSVVVFAGKVLAGSGYAACPTCGALLFDLQRRGTNRSVLCSACNRFHEGRSGKLWPIEVTRVADAPVFPARVSGPAAWPDGCAVCGAPAARTVPAKLIQVDVGGSLKRSVAGSAVAAPLGGSVVAVSTSTASVEVPHCGLHDDGAKLQANVDGQGLDIVFRSLPYQRAFCEKNRTVPAQFAHYSRSTGPLARVFGMASR